MFKEDVRNKIILEKKINIISTFPIPNTKEDIIEFLSLSISEANKPLGFFEKRLNCAILLFFAGLITVGLAWLLGFTYLPQKPFAAEKIKKAWRAKYEQVLIKGRSMRGDSDFIQQLDYYGKLLEK